MVVRQASKIILKSGRKLFCDPVTANSIAGLCEVISDVATLAKKVDLLLVCGGDGTMLRVVREIEGATTPIIGINIGRLGFLTAVPSQQLRHALACIWAGNFYIESRPIIEASGAARGEKVYQPALNDIVISRGAIPRMVEVEVAVNDEIVTRYRCDGLIVSSPTGSTAYSLSAGGAIISPEAHVFAITPICPHTLTNRSVIVGLDSKISVKVLSEKVETTVSADGQVQIELAAGDVINIRRSRRSVRLLHLAGSSFFDTVRRKLHWTGSNV